MITIPEAIDSNSVYDVLLHWMRYLTREDYTRAAQMLYTPKGEKAWTADAIQRGIETYGLYEDRPGEKFRVTDPYLAVDDDAILGSMGLSCKEIEFQIDVHTDFPMRVEWMLVRNLEKPDYIGAASMHYPINGRWGDLSSRFELRRVGGEIGLDLRYIDIM